MTATKAELNRYFEMINRRLPAGVSEFIRWLRKPSSFAARLAIAVLLILGGIFSFLPVLGIWMLPLGLNCAGYPIFLSRSLPSWRGWKKMNDATEMAKSVNGTDATGVTTKRSRRRLFSRRGVVAAMVGPGISFGFGGAAAGRTQRARSNAGLFLRNARSQLLFLAPSEVLVRMHDVR